MGAYQSLGRKCITGRGNSALVKHLSINQCFLSLCFFLGFYVLLAMCLAQNMEATLVRLLTKKSATTTTIIRVYQFSRVSLTSICLAKGGKNDVGNVRTRGEKSVKGSLFVDLLSIYPL